MALSQPEYSQPEVVAGLMELTNHCRLPEFMQRLSGVPRLLAPLRILPGVNNRTQAPAASRPSGQEVGAVAFDEAGAAILRDLQRSLRADLSAIVDGRLSRERRKQIAHEADRVTVKTRGAQRGKRPAYVETPDVKAAIGYVLHIMATGEYARRLAFCDLEGCGNFFLREPRQARPACYCSPAHAKQGKQAATAARGRDFRARKKAIKQLHSRYPSTAAEKVMAVAQPGLSTDQIVQRVIAASRQS